MITNGGMQVWQRGTAMGSGTSTYRQDMFKIERRGSTVPIVIRSTDVPAGEGFGYSARMYAIAEPDNGFHFYTTVELPGTGQYGVFETGTKMILSFWIKSAYSGRTIEPVMSLTDNLHTFGNSSTGLDSTEGSTAIPTSWTRMEFNYTMPSWSANAGSLGSVACAAIRFLMGADDTPIDIYITGVQLELGSNPTPFEHRSYADELARCQRYYSQVFIGIQAGKGNGTTSMGMPMTVPVSMRTTPTVSFSSVMNFTQFNDSSTRTDQPSGVDISGSDDFNTTFYCNVTGIQATTDNRGYTIQSGASLLFSAEL
jgi:hypothetical protein